jgi:preprotein translocase subunit YajC
MPGLLDLPLLLAQGAAPARQATPGSEFTSMLVMFLPLVFLFYFIVIRPQQRQEKMRRAMIEALKPNDRVLTSAGIVGTVVRIDPEKNRLVLRCDDVKLTFTRASVTEVLDKAETPG